MERREAGYDRQSPKKDAGVRDLGLVPSIEAAVRRRGHGRRRKRGTKCFASRPRNWRGRCLVPQLAGQREAAIYQRKRARIDASRLGDNISKSEGAEERAPLRRLSLEATYLTNWRCETARAGVQSTLNALAQLVRCCKIALAQAPATSIQYLSIAFIEQQATPNSSHSYLSNTLISNKTVPRKGPLRECTLQLETEPILEALPQPGLCNQAPAYPRYN